MRFLLQSMFWIAVVGAFLPRDVAAERDAATDLQASAARLCIDRPEVCAVGVEAAKLAVDLGEVAVDAARDALDESSDT